MKILLIRHGEPDYSIDSLTEKGWKEAELLSRRMETLNLRDIYVSPLGRARDTVRATEQRLNRAATVLPWLREFDGKVTGPFDVSKHVPWNLAPRYWVNDTALFHKDEWMHSPLMSNGETTRVYNETCRGFDLLLENYGYHRDGYIYICERNTSDTIALFCHFGISMAMLSHVFGIALPLLWQSFFTPPSSVTTLITEERVKGEVMFRCSALGDTSHLYANSEQVSASGLYPEVFEN